MPRDEDQLCQAVQFCKQSEIRYYLLGNGSNILFADEGFRGAVIDVSAEAAGMGLSIYQNADGDYISAPAGLKLSELCKFALQHGYTGLEFAYGIPGTVGGAVYMNAGAYGGEMKDVLASVDVLTQDLEIKTIPAAELNLGYRYSSIPEKGYIVLGATLQLKKGNIAEIRGRMAELAEQRRAKQPLQYPSAGSTFKRPEGYFAGKLVQDAGLKGKTIGGAQVSEKHSGFLINIGGATAQDILDLIAFCQKEVKDKFGVTLETEVKIVGEE